MRRSDLRNLAIIAHVDHGKTTLLDKLLEQSGMLSSHKDQGELIMDSNPLERERGITILAKTTAIDYQGVRINIVDTPGHADFGGEVERILNMVDGVLLLVDAAEGPMPQTKFVLRKALELGLQSIVAINKIDRQGAEPEKALNKVFDLFVELNATEEQLDFPYVYSSAKHGFATEDLEVQSDNLEPLFKLILERTPICEADPDKPFQMLISNIEYDNYLGRLLLGRINKGKIRSGERIAHIDSSGKIHYGKLKKMFFFQGLDRREAEEARAGDIVMVGGFGDGMVGETLACAENPEALPCIQVDAPTISMNFRINDGPFAGKDGKYVTSRHLRDRLYRELLSNIALKVEDTDSMDEFKVSGRGELHLSILIENMRRDGYEFGVSRPQVILKEIDGAMNEPIEELVIELPDDSMGSVMEDLGRRKADIRQVEPLPFGKVRLSANIPTRGLIGFRSACLTLTRGEAIMSHTLIGYEPFRGNASSRSHGVLIAKEQGDSIPYSIWKLQDRGYFIIPPNIPVYAGMIVGANSREDDLVVNVCAKKQLTNVRASGHDDAVKIVPHRQMSLEQALEFIADDELVEVTPKTIRLRKRILSEINRRLDGKKRKNGKK